MNPEWCEACFSKQKRFTTIVEFFAGVPTLEILEWEGPVCEWDEHFRFQPPKAQLILACIDAIKKFARPGQDSERFEDQECDHPEFGRGIVRLHRGFERSDGTPIYCRYLELFRPGGEPIKGVGRIKCEAILSVQNDIIAFVRKYAPPPHQTLKKTSIPSIECL